MFRDFWLDIKQAKNDGSVFFLPPASFLRRVLLHFCRVRLRLRGYRPGHVCCNVAVLFLFRCFSFLFLEVFGLGSWNILLTLSCSLCFTKAWQAQTPDCSPETLHLNLTTKLFNLNLFFFLSWDLPCHCRLTEQKLFFDKNHTPTSAFPLLLAAGPAKCLFNKK